MMFGAIIVPISYADVLFDWLIQAIESHYSRITPFSWWDMLEEG